MSDNQEANYAWGQVSQNLSQMGQNKAMMGQMNAQNAQFMAMERQRVQREIANESLIKVLNDPGLDAQGRMKAIFEIPRIFDTDAGQYMIQSRLSQMTPKAPSYQHVETAQGIGAFDPTTGQITQTGVQAPPAQGSVEQQRIANMTPEQRQAYYDKLAGITRMPTAMPKPPEGFVPTEMKIGDDGLPSYTFKPDNSGRVLTAESALSSVPQGMKISNLSYDKDGNIDNVSYVPINELDIQAKQLEIERKQQIINEKGDPNSQLWRQAQNWLTAANKAAGAMQFDKVEEYMTKADELISQMSQAAQQQASGFDEQAFQKWYKGWAEKAGINPDPDDPKHKYDYRAAYKAGLEPSISPEDGKYHWPSQFKADDHPNRYVDGVDTKTGRPVQQPQPYKSTRSKPKQAAFVQSTLQNMVGDIATSDAVMAKFDTLDEESKDQFEDILKQGDPQKIMKALERMGFTAQ